MALSTFSDLKTAVAAWLNRSDLTAVIPDFITLAEKQFVRELRQVSVTASLTIDAATVALPAACAELKSIRLVTGVPSADLPWRIGTVEQHAERLARAGGVSGRPDTAAVVGASLLVAPEPAESYTAEIVYVADVTPLSDAAPTNAVLTAAPDLYLFGALKEAAPYLVDDARVALWEGKYRAALDAENVRRDRREFGASLRPTRLPRVFG